jgi:hypothetical protein
LSEVQAIKEKHERELLDIKGVVGVGFNGSINVYVEKKDPMVVAFIPKTLEGVPVTVIETGKVKILSFPVASAVYGVRTSRIRPPLGGVSIGHPEATAGTLTCAVIDVKNNRLAGHSNNHVGALVWGTKDIGRKGDDILQPGIYDGGVDPDDTIGHLERWEKVSLDKPNVIDSCIFDCGEIPKIADVGKHTRTVEPKIGMNVKKSGRTSGLTFSKFTDLNATLKVEGWGDAVFTNQVVARPAFSLPGDSGSWVGNENDETVGVVFAGSPEITIVNKAVEIERILNIEFAPELGYLSLPMTLAVLAPVPATILGAWLTTKWRK